MNSWGASTSVNELLCGRSVQDWSDVDIYTIVIHLPLNAVEVSVCAGCEEQATRSTSSPRAVAAIRWFCWLLLCLIRKVRSHQ